MNDVVQEASEDIAQFFSQPNAFRSILILISAIIIAYIASRFLAKFIVFIAQRVSDLGDKESNVAKQIRYRQIETYLSIVVAIVRAAVVAVVAYFVWRMLSPMASSGAAAIGASAFFIVFAGQTLGMVLRDITAGVIMITEQWFHVGDYIKIEPFIDVGGVVERFTLRSTRLRSLSGEVVWVHNQQIQAVHVTPSGHRTFAVDLFTKDKEKARKAIESVIKTIPSSMTLLASPLKIKTVENWGADTWHIEVHGKTAPGREWLIEKYFVNAIKSLDEDKQLNEKLFEYEPIARYADPDAERKFKRAMKYKNDQ